jgi:hypothetical protein
VRIYSVYRGPTPKPNGDDLNFVSEGFSWIAFLLPLIWALYHRLWLVAISVLIVIAGVGYLAAAFGLTASMENAIYLAVVIVFGFEANNLRRWTMWRRGWRQVAIVGGRDIGAAERRLFDLFALTPTGTLIPRSESQWPNSI